MDASFRGLRQVFQSRNLPRSLQTEAAVPRKECQSLLLFLPKSLEGEGREGGGEASTLGGTAPALPAEEVTPCVVALGAPGPPAKCLETTHLGQEGLEGRGWAPRCEGALAAPFLLRG